jgi:uncharacterized membrane protein YgcG
VLASGILGYMAYSARTRDRYRTAVRVATGVTSVGVLTATGWVAVAQASDHRAEHEAQAAADQSAAEAHARAEAEYVVQLAAFEVAQTRAVTKPTRLAAAPEVIRPVVVEPRISQNYLPITDPNVGSGGDVDTGDRRSSGGGSGGNGSGGGSGGNGSGGNGSGGGNNTPAPTPPPPPPPPSSGS